MAVTINGVSVDLAARTIRDEQGQALPLRPQCFDVLRILLENPHRVVSKRELMQEVWPDVVVTDDSLVQCIHEIRKVLRDSHHSTIKTAQRQGYRFEEPATTQVPLVPRSRFAPARFAVISIVALISASVGGWLALQPQGASDRHANGLTSFLETAFGRVAPARSEADPATGKAREEYLLGLYHFHKPSPKNLAVAKDHFEASIRLDPAHSDAYVALAKTYARVSTLAYSRALRINFYDADLKARKALEHLNAETAETHTVWSWLALRKFQVREAIAEAETALALRQDDTDAMEALARAKIFGGEPRRGLELAADMMRQNPALADRSLLLMGLAEFALEDYAKAAQDIERGMDLGSQDIFYAGILAAAHGLLGNADKSRQAYQTFMTGFGERPDLARQMIVYPFSDPRTAQLLAAGLETAGAKVWYSLDDGGYLRLDNSTRLTGREIAHLLKSSRIVGKGFWCGESWERGETAYGLVEYDGTPIHRGMPSDAVGTSSVEGDLLCEKWPTETGDRQYCSPVYRVTEGKAQARWGTYVVVTDTGPHPFSLITRTAQAQALSGNMQ